MPPIEPIDPRILGRRLTEARVARGITQEQAAARLGCSRPTLIAVEKGTRMAKPAEIVELAAFYGKSVHELVRPGAPVAELQPHLRAAVDLSRGGAEDLYAAIAELQEFAIDYRELERLAGTEPAERHPPELTIPPWVDIRDYAEVAASRERLRLFLGDQPVPNVRQVLESEAGLRVFCSGLPSAVAGMYAYAAELGYCVLINRKHPVERRRFTLAHEYGHFLTHRHKPGIDYFFSSDMRKPRNEAFADAFAACFLMPETGVRRLFMDIRTASKDFQVADLCRLSNLFGVSVEAMCYRLEALGLIPKGTWDSLAEKDFRPAEASRELNLVPRTAESEEPYPERYRDLAVLAFCQERITEGQLGRFLRCDRVRAREVVEECRNRTRIGPEGSPGVIRLPFEASLLKRPV